MVECFSDGDALRRIKREKSLDKIQGVLVLPQSSSEPKFEPELM
jgi:hypothetical protein